jgi:N-acetylmuramoyl-L-alanine amidase
VKSLLILLILSFTLFANASKVIVVIDPGHGGKDPGHLAVKKGHKDEKDLNLEIALKLGGYLTSYLKNVEVHYTRRTDSYTSLTARVDFANNLKADYFISIHCNGSANDQIHGTETHIHDKKAKKSMAIAMEIEQQFRARAARYSRGIKTGDDRGNSVQILKYTNMPSVLIECGFLTNITEANFLNTTYGQEIIASAIFRGIRAQLQKNHPKIDFLKPTDQLHAAKKVYKIQIMSSIEPIEKNHASFKPLGVPVERTEVNSKSRYKYKYYIGSFSTSKEAEELLAKAKKNGFPDAFITAIE